MDEFKPGEKINDNKFIKLYLDDSQNTKVMGIKNNWYRVDDNNIVQTTSQKNTMEAATAKPRKS